jgi:hypothetical protein
MDNYFNTVTKMYKKSFDEKVRCDLCEAEYSEGEIYKSDDLIYLCPACLEKIEAAPEPIRQSMERILIGNVI